MLVANDIKVAVHLSTRSQRETAERHEVHADGRELRGRGFVVVGLVHALLDPARVDPVGQHEHQDGGGGEDGCVHGERGYRAPPADETTMLRPVSG